MEFWEEGHGRKAPLSSHHIKGMYNQHDLPLLMLTLVTWLPGLAAFPTVQYCSHPTLSLLGSLEGTHCVQPTLKGGELRNPPQGASIHIKCLELFYIEDFSFLSFFLSDFLTSFIVLLVSMSMESGYLFYALGLIQHFLIFCSNWSSCGHWKLSQLLCP